MNYPLKIWKVIKSRSQILSVEHTSVTPGQGSYSTINSTSINSRVTSQSRYNKHSLGSPQHCAVTWPSIATLADICRTTLTMTPVTRRIATFCSRFRIVHMTYQLQDFAESFAYSFNCILFCDEYACTRSRTHSVSAEPENNGRLPRQQN